MDKLENIKVNEVLLTNGNKIIIINYKGDGDPVHHIDNFISENINENNYTEFVDIDMDNPWVRIIVTGNNTKEVI